MRDQKRPFTYLSTNLISLSSTQKTQLCPEQRARNRIPVLIYFSMFLLCGLASGTSMLVAQEKKEYAFQQKTTASTSGCLEASPPKEFPIVVNLDEPLATEISKLAYWGTQCLYLSDYDSALAIFDEIKNMAPERPIGYTHAAVVYYVIMTDFHNYDHTNAFISNIDASIEYGKQITRRGGESQPWANFYIGAANGISGLFYAKYGKLFKSFSLGLRGLKYMSAILEYQENFHDSYYGVGLYHYWYGKIFKKLMSKQESKSLREQGINELTTAFTMGTAAKVLSGVALLDIYRQEGNIVSSMAIIDRLTTLYPEFSSVYTNLGPIYELTLHDDELITHYETTLARLVANEYATPLTGIDIKASLARLYYAKGEKSKSSKILDDVNNNPSLNKILQAKSTPEYFQEIQEGIDDFLEEISS